MLDASNQVRDELVDRPFVLHSSRNSLGHFDFVSFTVGTGKEMGNIDTGMKQNAGFAGVSFSCPT